jgi:hypothetical protein
MPCALANMGTVALAEASVTLIRYALGYLNVPASKAASYLFEFRNAIELAHRESREPMAGLPQVRELVITREMATEDSIGQQRVRERFGVTILTITKHSGDTIMNPADRAF